MANFSNTLSTQNPKASALQSKMNPTPLKGVDDVMNFFKQNAQASNPSRPMSSNIASPMGAFSSNPQNSQPQPTTPVKSTATNADGSTKTEYHAPQQNTDGAGATGATQQPKYNNPLIQPALDAQNRAVNINQALNQAVNDRTKQGIALPFVQGQQGALQRDYGVQAQAATQEAQNAATMAGYGQPQQYSLYSQPYNPLTDTYGGGGQGGAINRSVQASNITSAGDYTKKINDTEQSKNAFQANFNVLNDLAQQGGAPSNVPILGGLIQRFGQVVGGKESPQVAAFKTQFEALRNQYQSLTGGSLSVQPDAVTPDMLKQIQATINDKVQNDLASYKQQLGSLQDGSSSTSNSAPTSNTSEVTIGSSKFTQDANGNWVVKK